MFKIIQQYKLAKDDQIIRNKLFALSMGHPLAITNACRYCGGKIKSWERTVCQKCKPNKLMFWLFKKK